MARRRAMMASTSRGARRGWAGGRRTAVVAVVACALAVMCGAARGEGGSAVASFDRRGPDGEVMELSETNFDETVGRGAPVLV